MLSSSGPVGIASEGRYTGRSGSPSANAVVSVKFSAKGTV